jgi:hypothetical protein
MELLSLSVHYTFARFLIDLQSESCVTTTRKSTICIGTFLATIVVGGIRTFVYIWKKI